MSLLFSTGAFASSLSGAAPGMVLLTPSSIAHSGTSASIGTNGQVTFSAVTSLSLNGCFTADFDNYVIVYDAVSSIADRGFSIRLRAAGTDASGSDYIDQALHAYNTLVYADRSSAKTSTYIGGLDSVLRSGSYASVYGPALAQPTAFRNVSVDSVSNASLINHAGTHSLSTAYDGFSMVIGGWNATGKIAVYGVRS